MKPKYLSEISYPPSKYINTYGRVNDVGQSMFYGSIGKGAPITELNVKIGDTLVMGLWNVKDELFLNHIGFTSKTALSLNSKRPLQSIYEWVDTTKNQHELNGFIYDYLTEVFIRKIPEEQNYLYKLSIAIANHLLNHPALSGLMYPSISMFGNTDNIVLKPEYVDKSLEFVAVEFVEITGLINDVFQYQVLDTAAEVDNDGIIQWTGRYFTFSTEPSFNITSMDGSYIHKDENGHLIRPKANGDVISKLTPLQKEFKTPGYFYLKIEKNFNVSVGFEGECLHLINILVNLNFDIRNKDKFLTFYIPETEWCNVISNTIIQNYNGYLGIDDSRTTEVRNENTGEIQYTTQNTLFNSTIIIFSERRFDTTEIELQKPNSIILKFHFADMIKV